MPAKKLRAVVTFEWPVRSLVKYKAKDLKEAAAFQQNLFDTDKFALDDLMNIVNPSSVRVHPVEDNPNAADALSLLLTSWGSMNGLTIQGLLDIVTEARDMIVDHNKARLSSKLTTG